MLGALLVGCSINSKNPQYLSITYVSSPTISRERLHHSTGKPSTGAIYTLKKKLVRAKATRTTSKSMLIHPSTASF
jgi:hypothetical protein